MLKHTLAALITAVLLSVGLVAAPAQAVKVPPKCKMTGSGLARDVSICIQASYKQPTGGRCPKWRKVLVGIGVGGQHLEEGNGAVLRRVTIRKSNGDYLGNHRWDNLLETAEEDHYRIFYGLDTDHSRSQSLTVRVYDAELLIKNGRNRTVSFTRTFYPWSSC